MIEINLVEPKAKPISPFCIGMYILPLWKQTKTKTHFMLLILKKNFEGYNDRYKLSLVIEKKDN